MKKILIFLYICFLLNSYLIGIEINNYEYEIIGIVPYGNGKKQLGFSDYPEPAFPGPSCFNMIDDELIYVCDSFNSRIAIINFHKNYFNTINLTGIHQAVLEEVKEIQVNKENNILLYARDWHSKCGIIKVKRTGIIELQIKQEKIYNAIYLYSNSYMIDKYIYFYDKKIIVDS